VLNNPNASIDPLGLNGCDNVPFSSGCVDGCDDGTGWVCASPGTGGGGGGGRGNTPLLPVDTGGGGGGGRTGSAPNTGAILGLLSKAVTCHASAFKKGGIALATDAIGAIPGEGNALRLVQLAAGGVGFGNGLVQRDAAGAVGNILTSQTVLVGAAAQRVGATALEAIPVLGNFASAGFAVRDLINEAQDAYACMGGN